MHGQRGDQASHYLLSPLDAVDFHRLTTPRHSDIRRLLANYSELVHHLQLHILGHGLFPEACPVYGGCLAFEKLHIVGRD